MLRPYPLISILSWYVSREFTFVFLLAIGAFNAVYLVIDFFQTGRRFFEYEASMGLALLYYLCRIPMITFQTIPLAVLLSTLVTLGVLSRHMEVTAMKAGGISLYRIARPIFLISLGIAFINFFGNEYLAPYAYQKSEYIMNVEVRKRDPGASFKDLNIWYKEEAGIYNFQAFDPDLNTLKGITVYLFDENFRLVQRVDAHDAVWHEDRWTFNDVTIRRFPKKESMTVENRSHMDIFIDLRPENLTEVEKSTEEMGYTELKRYVHRLRKAGYDATKYIVDLKIKLSSPFINLVMVLIGIPFALKTGRTGGFAAGVGISLAIGFTYWILISVSRAFGHSGILPAFLSAWSPHLLFGGAGLIALLSIRQ
jgi:lipopolysaccharide export system permease protein